MRFHAFTVRIKGGHKANYYGICEKHHNPMAGAVKARIERAVQHVVIHNYHNERTKQHENAGVRENYVAVNQRFLGRLRTAEQPFVEAGKELNHLRLL